MTKSMIFFVGFVGYLILQHIDEVKSQFTKPLGFNPHAVAVFEEVRPLKLNNREKECLARNVYYEAGTEEILGKIAVAQVTLNRVQTGYWGDHVCDVVYAPEQFSWTKYNDKVNTRPTGHLWKESLLAVSTVVDNGVRIRQMNKALFYHADYVRPFWRDNKKMIGQIGSHIFYRGDKNSWIEL